ncbi:TrbL/VirB6 plasmid conjugal transfer protein [Nocardioides albertanoniae]|uniref:TrbL/VirB6 plasmid conjugal transfer protein n=1 Tax=Nocardioides albertanoniae TaxID=1175486 RepID=A0A543ACH4_9ACTN|nr:DNA/RNA non-specific endonuclease [Nocardioides albertanoniae]TQL70291.1 TrbL/VirB6 plasmid conjugal transfer protein [Nocardioides albertanoniae]
MALLGLTFVVIGSIVAGSPAGAADLACNNDDAPIPASPHGAGSWIVQLEESPKDADPFDDEGVSLESTYGTTPQLWTYDNGCTGQFVAGAGTAIGNILLQVSGTFPNWTHALLNAVVDPDSPVQALDNPVVDATRAVTDGVWRPWITVAVLLVAATAIWRARTGHVAGSATAVAWAGVVLLTTTLLISYPVESVRLVDDGVRNVVTLIATGFDDHPAPGEDPAVAAIDGQMDELVRSTQYRTWLTGALGDADSETAREHGPDLFRATHFTFDEYETYRSDPEGEGKAIVEEKQDAFKTIAGQIDREDSVAYEYFKGEHWGQRATAGLVNLIAVFVTCGYLLIAGLAILLAFVLIRLIVPFAPAAGILFMFDRTRDLAVGWLHRVIGPLVMGPIYFVVALVLLRFFSAILTSTQVHYTLKLAICAVLTYIAWRFTRPAAYGIGHIWGAAGFAWGMATGWRRSVVPYRDPELHASATANSSSAPVAPGLQNEAAPQAVTAEGRPAALLPPPSPPVPMQPSAPASTSSSGAAELAVSKVSPIQERWPRPGTSRRAPGPKLGPRTSFPGNDFALESNTAYEVPGRGTYYTDGEGRLLYAETAYGDASRPNPDLNSPAPNVTYAVSDRHVFITDTGSRTIEAHDPHMVRRDTPRSGHIQADVGKKGGPGYDGGHLIANYAGGGRERVNIVAMLQELNRPGSPEYGSIPNNFYKLESNLRDAVDRGHDVSFSLYVDYDDDGPVPTTITVEYSIDGVADEKEFENVRPPRL